MPCAGYGDVSSIDGFQIVTHMKILGSILESNCSIQLCLSNTLNIMLKITVCNLDKGLKLCTDDAKLRWLTTVVLPIARSRWARWPYTTTTAARINAMQRKLLALVFEIRPSKGESADTFRERRHLLTTAMSRHQGLWSREWEKSIHSWHAHVVRSSDGHAWSGKLLAWHGDEWLRSKRSGNRTGTRVLQAGPCKRWGEGLVGMPAVDRRT